VSVALQYGVPVESLVTKFAHQRFEPMGMTTNADIPFAKSLVDYIFRWLGMQFIPGYREQNAPRRAGGHEPSSHEIRKTETRKIESIKPEIKEDACAQGTSSPATGSMGGTGSSPLANSGWATRRENALSAVKSERNDSTSGGGAASIAPAPITTSRMTAAHAVTAVTETTIAGSSVETRVIEAAVAVERTVKTVAANALDASNAALMGDAPACDGCGSITVRNGTCYRCLNCGNSMGCS